MPAGYVVGPPEGFACALLVRLKAARGQARVRSHPRTPYPTPPQVFLRAAGRIEAAKKVFVLDGFVTDHVTLLQVRILARLEMPTAAL